MMKKLPYVLLVLLLCVHGYCGGLPLSMLFGENAQESAPVWELTKLADATLDATFYGSIPDGFSINIDWGDGNDTDFVGPKTNALIDHDYGDAMSYDIVISGNVAQVTGFMYFPNTIPVAVDISTFASGVGLTGISTIAFSQDTDITGDVGSLAPLTNLTGLRFDNTAVTYTSTTLPDWSACTITLNNCGWSQSTVDAFLIDLAASSTASTATLTLDGTNSAPSTTGESAIDTLRGLGWTVTVTGGY